MSRSMRAYTVLILWSADVTTERNSETFALSLMRSDSQSQRARLVVFWRERMGMEKTGAASARRSVHQCMFKGVTAQEVAKNNE